MFETRSSAHRVLLLLQLALVQIGCAPAPNVVRLRTADGPVRVTRLPPRPPHARYARSVRGGDGHRHRGHIGGHQGQPGGHGQRQGGGGDGGGRRHHVRGALGIAGTDVEGNRCRDHHRPRRLGRGAHPVHTREGLRGPHRGMRTRPPRSRRCTRRENGSPR